jgi:hypothetical protein
MIILGTAQTKAPRIMELRRKFVSEIKDDRLLARVGSALEHGRYSLTELKDFFSLPLERPSREIPSPEPSSPAPSQSHVDILRIFGDASHALMGWPQDTAGYWIQRPELEDLRAILTRNPSSFTALLGDAGSGKSALLARLATELSEEGVALLALQADVLPKEMRSLSDLDESLGFPGSLVDCIQQLANTRTVILLIDQIDALAEIMDQQTSRLTVLLSLINRLRNTENVHILFSCRDFEFRHEMRLSTLRPAPVRLIDPQWESINQVLGCVGIDSSNWPPDAREVLRRPQHLSLFIEHLAN